MAGPHCRQAVKAGPRIAARTVLLSKPPRGKAASAITSAEVAALRQCGKIALDQPGIDVACGKDGWRINAAGIAMFVVQPVDARLGQCALELARQLSRSAPCTISLAIIGS